MKIQNALFNFNLILISDKQHVILSLSLSHLAHLDFIWHKNVGCRPGWEESLVSSSKQLGLRFLMRDAGGAGQGRACRHHPPQGA